jgi:chitodextrinase
MAKQKNNKKNNSQSQPMQHSDNKATQLLRNKKGAVIFVLAFAAVGIVSIVLSHAASVATLALTPSSSTVDLGATVTYTIVEDSSSDPVNAVESDLTYDQTKLQFDSVSTATSGFSSFPSAVGGNGSVTIPALSTTALTGQQTVATVTFTALAPGTTPITFASTSAIVETSDNQDALSGTTGATLTIADTTAPTAPTDVTASAETDSSISLSWTAATDNVGVTGYEVLRNGTEVQPSTTGTTFTDTGLKPETSYSYTVIAYDAAGNDSPASSAVSASTTVDSSPPVAPSALKATATSSTSVSLSWTPATADGLSSTTGYYVYRDGSKVGSPAAISYVDSTAAAGTTYTYTVAAYNTYGTSAQSTSVSVTTPTAAAPSPPAAPSALIAKAGTGSVIDLSWTAPSGGTAVTGYEVYRDTTKLASASGTSYIDTSALAGTSYSYYVVALDAAGDMSADSNSVTITASTPPPSAPTGVTAKADSSSEVTLSWSPAADTSGTGVTGYYILRSTGKAAPTSDTSVTGTTFNDTALSAGTIYNYQVEAFDAAGDVSSASTVVSVNTPAAADTTPPTVSLTSPSGGKTVSGTVTLSATASDNVAVTKVEFLVDGTVLSTETASPYMSAWNTSGVTDGSHTIVAEAFDAAGNNAVSSASVTVSNSDTQKPSAPTKLVASLPTGSTSSAVQLSWDASTDNVGVTGYYILRSSGGGEAVTIGQVAGTIVTYTDSTALPGIAYSYEVEAFDAAGNISNPSNLLTVTTSPTKDTTPPSQVMNLQAVSASTSQINLSWSAATDNVGVAGYQIFRNGTKIATIAQISYGDTGLSTNTHYSYYVKAVDAAGNTGEASATSSATTFESNPSTLRYGSISGTVTDSRSKLGLPNTFVLFARRGVIDYATTNQSGSYSFSKVPTGEVLFTWYHDGYRLSDRHVNISAQQNSSVYVAMDKQDVYRRR